MASNLVTMNHSIANMSSSSLDINCTNSEDPYLTGYNIFSWTLSALIIISNVLLISVILKSPVLRTTRFNMIMISLGCTDLLVGFFIPFNTIQIGHWTLGHHFCEFVTSMWVILLCASIYHFVCVNVDRLIAIKMPLKYLKLKGKNWLVKVAILACWVLSLVPAIPMWTRFDTRTVETDGTCFTCSFPYNSAEWVWWSALTAFILPTVIILVIWLAILHHCCKENSFNFESASSAMKRRVTITMGTITMAFLLCWWPFAIIFMMGEHDPTILHMVVAIGYLNSLINPVLYICINTPVRRAIVTLFTSQDRFPKHPSTLSSVR
eukprot:GFUD01096347.1.p1 GENE.GFUD01096347.1~~GFUD01096347.1.p1  ORF type:complete len:336 (-),score=66.48 GFUD01096347.1:205-1170(-)